VTQSFTPELKRLLLAAGCRFVRAGKGDLEIWHSPVTQVHFVVDSKIKFRHTANSCAQAGRITKVFLSIRAGLADAYP
jgi:hypothetical protein